MLWDSLGGWVLYQTLKREEKGKENEQDKTKNKLKEVHREVGNGKNTRGQDKTEGWEIGSSGTKKEKSEEKEGRGEEGEPGNGGGRGGRQIRQQKRTEAGQGGRKQSLKTGGSLHLGCREKD